MEKAHTSGRTYVLTWLSLLGLTGASFGFSFVPAGALDAVVAVAIATGKALLVAIIFMHLREARFASRMVLVVAVVFVLLLCGLIATDVLFRRTFPPAARPPAAATDFDLKRR